MIAFNLVDGAAISGLFTAVSYSTARDMGILAAYAMENPVFAKTVSTKSMKIGERYLTNHNKLLWRVEGADGVKTGYTKAAGRILVSSATRNERRLIAVTMDDPNDWEDHAALLEQGFSRYSPKTIVKKGQYVDTLEVAGGQGRQVTVLAKEDFSYALAEGETPQLMLPGPGFVYAPAVEGADAGTAYVLLNGKAIGKVPVVYGQTIEQTPEEPTKLQKLLSKVNLWS